VKNAQFRLLTPRETTSQSKEPASWPSHELGEEDRFEHVGVGPERIAVQEVCVLARGGEDHHREQLRALVGADAPEHLQSVDAEQLQTEQDQRGDRPFFTALAQQIVERFDPIRATAISLRGLHLPNARTIIF